jgi:ion channel
MAPPPASEDARVRDRLRGGRYGLVLILVGTSLVFQMAAHGSDLARFVTVLLQAVTLFVVVRTAGAHRGVVRAAAIVAVTAALAALVIWVVRGDIPRAPAAVANGLLILFAPPVIAAGLLRALRQQETVTAQTLSGVLAIYLLVGMLFSFVYGVIGAVDADALFSGVTTTTVSDELYFSFVTLCTVGYGDFTPAGDFTRALAVGEMLIGQIYLVTVVSLIVANLGRRRP